MIRIDRRLQPAVPAHASRATAPPEPVETPDDAALTALLAAQVADYEVIDSEARLAVADDWIASHDDSDRRWDEAQRRRSRIETQRVIQLRACWTACVALCEALGAMTAAESWMTANAPEIGTQAAEGIWQSLMGERLIPAGVRYPAEVSPLPGWMRDELHMRRDGQREAVAV